MKVFIADDSEYICNSLKAMLSKIPGIEIIGQAGETREAIELIYKLKPEVVILDIRMPGGSGMEVLKQIKKNASAPLVIILTNFPYPQYRKKCMELGADFFFEKSSEFARIPEVLKQLMKESSA